MCTVSYIPQKEQQRFYLTSNRDERKFRPTVAPKSYTYGKQRLIYPKDEKAGGSWITYNGSNKVVCLLNGGFIAHQKQAHHTISRGTVVIEYSLSDQESQEYFKEKDLNAVEPFTLVTVIHRDFQPQLLSEFIWDGNEKHHRILNPSQAYIWSSATLYGQRERALRQEWFNAFIKQHHGAPDGAEILAFHSGEHSQDKRINVIMEREDALKTVSITQIDAHPEKEVMIYKDLLNSTNYTIGL